MKKPDNMTTCLDTYFFILFSAAMRELPLSICDDADAGAGAGAGAGVISLCSDILGLLSPEIDLYTVTQDKLWE